MMDKDPYKNRRCVIYGQPGKVHGTFFTSDGWKVTLIGLDNGAKVKYPSIRDITFEGA